MAAGDGTDNFVGTIYETRVFDALLTEAEHDVYHAGTLTSFWNSPYAKWRCDSYNDDTDGDRVWDETILKRDLYKADQSASAKYPVIGLTPTPYYSFDGIDDYLSNLPTLPSAYTITGVKSDPDYPTVEDYPIIQQHNDTTFTDLLTAEGGFTGLLHSLLLHDTELTQLQKYHDEYMQMYWLWRGRAYGYAHRLIVEDVCVFAEFLDYVGFPFTDYARDVVGTPTLVTGGGATGSLFASATSNIEFPHATALQCEQVTIVVYGDFAGSEAAGTIVDKGTNYKFLTNGNQLDFNGSTIAHTFDNNEQIAVTCKPGFKPRFYVDGAYIGEGSSTITPDDTDTTALNIGNNNEKNSPTAYAIKQVLICNKALNNE